MNGERVEALLDLMARLEFATTDEMAAAVVEVNRLAPGVSTPGVAALLEAYADLLEAQLVARRADVDDGLAWLLGSPGDVT